jgi:hypothetical protein
MEAINIMCSFRAGLDGSRERRQHTKNNNKKKIGFWGSHSEALQSKPHSVIDSWVLNPLEFNPRQFY